MRDPKSDFIFLILICSLTFWAISGVIFDLPEYVVLLYFMFLLWGISFVLVFSYSYLNWNVLVWPSNIIVTVLAYPFSQMVQFINSYLQRKQKERERIERKKAEIIAMIGRGYEAMKEAEKCSKFALKQM